MIDVRNLLTVIARFKAVTGARKRVRQFVALGAALLLGTCAVQAQLIAYEGFNYAAGSLVGANGGSGWAGPWQRVTTDTASSDQLVNATGLGIANMASAGGRIVQPANDHRNYRAIDMTIPALQPYIDSTSANSGTIRATYGPALGKSGTTLWFSMLIKTTSPYFAKYGGMHLMDGMDLSQPYGDKALHQRFQFGKDHDTHWGFSRTTNGYTGISSQNFASSVLADAQLHLLVYRIDFQSVDQTQAWMWIDPVVGTAPALASAAVHATGIYDFHFNAVNVGADGVFDFDELRIGLTYADVVPPTVPLFALSVVRDGTGSGAVTSADAQINCGATCAANYPSASVVTLSAAPLANSIFTGWLGACRGVTPTCAVTVNSSMTASATFAPIGKVATLDVDGSGASLAYDALTDGALIVRFLLGMTGPALTSGIVNGAGSRTSSTAISDYLTNIKPALDIDGNGVVDLPVDALLIVRYLMGFRGSALLAGGTGTGATRTTVAEIETWLQSLSP